MPPVRSQPPSSYQPTRGADTHAPWLETCLLLSPMRKAVLGEDYVNKSLASADTFNGPFQEILNEYCWGMVWTDEHLPKKTRSMLNLVMLACLGRMHEWELHLKGALTNGVTKDEVQAILHQIA